MNKNLTNKWQHDLPAEKHKHQTDYSCHIVIQNVAYIAKVNGETVEQCINRADLICEAGNILNETGLTPEKILESRNTLLQALKDTRAAIIDSGHFPANSILVKSIDLEISKHGKGSI